jgi:hypothetical protein
MAIVKNCPHCGRKFGMSSANVGKKLKCPHCAGIVVPPSSSAEHTPVAGADCATLPPKGTADETNSIDTRRQRGQGVDAGTKGEEVNAIDFLAPAAAPDEIGRLGPYRILKVLGAGGMGMVFEADDPQLKRRVALKVMLPSLAASESARKRFLREAQAAAAIDHDHIVTIHQVGEDRGVPYLAMPLLQGGSLESRLQDQGAGTPLPLDEVLRIGREVAEGLAAAHTHGLIHRDIKPANIWLESRVRGRKGEGEKGRKGEKDRSAVSSPPLPFSPSPILTPPRAASRFLISGWRGRRTIGLS